MQRRERRARQKKEDERYNQQKSTLLGVRCHELEACLIWQLLNSPSKDCLALFDAWAGLQSGIDGRGEDGLWKMSLATECTRVGIKGMTLETPRGG